MGMPGERYTSVMHGRPRRSEREILLYLPHKQRGKKGIFIGFTGGDSPAQAKSKWLRYVQDAGYAVHSCETLAELERIVEAITKGEQA